MHVLEYIKYISVIIHGKKVLLKMSMEQIWQRERKGREGRREGGTEKEKGGRGIEEEKAGRRTLDFRIIRLGLGSNSLLL